MSNLTPVAGNPFAPSSDAGTKGMTPVEGNPFAPGGDTLPETVPLSERDEYFYRLAANPQDRAAVLARTYGANNVRVNKDTGELYALTPRGRAVPGSGGFLHNVTPSAAAGAPLVVSQIAGEAGGAAIGSLGGPIGTAAGFVAGGGVGSAGGQTFNDLILRYGAGVGHSASQQVANDWDAATTGAAWSAAGGALFKGVPALYGLAKEAAFARASSASEAFSKFRNFDQEVERLKKSGTLTTEAMINVAKKFLGVDPDLLAHVHTAVAGAEEQGVKLFTNPMTYANEAPAIGQLIALASKFGVSNVVSSTREYMETAGRKLSAKLGEAGEVGKSVFGKPVDVERLGASLREGVQTRVDKALSEVHAAADNLRALHEREVATAEMAIGREGKAASDAWERAKTDLAAKVKTLEAARDEMVAGKMRYLHTMMGGLLDVAGPLGSSADVAARADFGRLSKGLAQEVESVKRTIGEQHGTVLEAAYAEGGSRLLGSELPAALRSLIDHAIPSEQAALKEILASTVPASLRSAARLSATTTTETSLVDAAGKPLTLTEPTVVSLKEMNEFKKVLGQQASNIFDKVAPNMQEGLKKRVFGLVRGFIHDGGEDVPEAWRSAASKIEEANDRYHSMMEEIESRLITPMMAEAKSGLVKKDLDVVARDVFEKVHPREVMDRLFSKYAPQNRAHLVGADLFNIFHDAASSTGATIRGLPSVDVMKVARAFADRDARGVLEHYGDPHLIGAIRGLIKDVAALDPEKTLATALHPSRSMLDVINSLREQKTALDALAAKNPVDAFLHRIDALSKEGEGALRMISEQEKTAVAGVEEKWAKSELGSLRGLRDSQLESAAVRVLESPHHVREVIQEFGTDSPQFRILRETFNRRLLEHAVEGDDVLSYAEHLADLKIKPEVASMLSVGAETGGMLRMAEYSKLALRRMRDVYMSLHAGALVAEPPKIVQAAVRDMFGKGVTGAATGFLAKSIDRLILGKTVGVAAAALEHPSVVKILQRGAEMSPEEMGKTVQAWLEDTSAKIPVGGIIIARAIQKRFPELVRSLPDGSLSVKVPVLMQIRGALSTGAKATFRGTYAVQQQEQSDGDARSTARTLGLPPP